MKEKMAKMLVAVMIFVAAISVTVAGVQANEEPISMTDQQLWWKKKDKDELPRLGGGSENPERIQEQPVSNIILQQRYPETIVLQGSTTEKKIALTFDDGPDPRFSETVLDLLKEYNVPATFFVMGSRAVAYPEIIERVIAEGHVIGNHTYFHPNLVKEGDLATLEREVTRTENILNEIIGYRTKLFRAPYGFLYNELVEKLRDMDYSVVVWSIDSLDWQEDPPEVIADNVLNNIHPGAIVLMHDGGDWDADRTNTIAALRQIIPALQKQGYQFVTVPELLNIPYQK
ncbi:polysaccharide deacetylase family protein [Bacillaceae bacterium IKA-2]|nr:polysaccharide deacetylase family protein [Bacillaceae bacterium IKA-2]